MTSSEPGMVSGLGGAVVGSVRVVCRVHDGENSKPRPSWYSKELALASLVRAAGAVDATVDFLLDGPVRPSLTSVIAASGTATDIPGGSARGSYRSMIAWAVAQDGPDDDLLWFSEDDYLYRPDALCLMAEVAERAPWAAYFTLSGSECVDPGAPRTRPRPRSEPGAAGEPDALVSRGVGWYPALATASTFGVRRWVLREDAALLRAVPFAGGAWDSATCFVLQGLRPYSFRELIGHGEGGSVPRAAARVPVRAAVSLLALRPASRRRVLLGPDPELARHLEMPEPYPRTPPSSTTATYDWEALAARTADWAVAEGLQVWTTAGLRDR